MLPTTGHLHGHVMKNFYVVAWANTKLVDRELERVGTGNRHMNQ